LWWFVLGGGWGGGGVICLFLAFHAFGSHQTLKQNYF